MTINRDLNNRVTILGSGTSTGIPIPGCHCDVCKSQNVKNRRFRTSIYIQTKEKKDYLVDTTPDLRSQLLANQIEHVDGVILTHSHADHLHGIDDLRSLCFFPTPRRIPLYTDPRTCEELEDRFAYIFARHKVFTKKPHKGGGLPELDLKPLENNTHPDLPMEFFALPHGNGQSLGIYHDGMAYLIDCHEVPDAIVDYLKEKQLNLLIIDCVKTRPHTSHLNVEKAFEYIKRIAPNAAGLIHMSHDLEHEELAVMAQNFFDFPVFPVYDGLVLEY